jgi:hypothetical protein
VNPNRASGLGLIQTHYGLEIPKSLCGEWLEMDEVSDVFLCVLERRTPYLLSTALIPSVFVSV